MVWLMVLALVIVLLVAAAVLPRRGTGDASVRFPWFWIIFPATCFAIAATVGVFAVPSGGGFGWSMYPPGRQFLTNEQFNQIIWRDRAIWVLPAASVVGVGLSVWSWRRWKPGSPR